MWIDRDFSHSWERASLPVRLLSGLRQSGKSSYLHRVRRERIWISLDDLASREFAQRDPHLFLSHLCHQFVIDEVQLAPQLLPEIKRRVDEWRMSDRSRPEPSFWLTGSNQILLDRALKESLAGRATYYRFFPLSVSELHHAGLSTAPEMLFLRGGWPELHTNLSLSPVQYLSDYITTVIEKDVVLAAGIEKVREFLRAVRLLAGRTSQMLVVSNIAQDAGVKQPTVQGWISVLERMQILSTVEPYSSSLNHRLLRTPKLYFNDVGLAVRLQGWNEISPLLISPQVGPLFETLVYTEIIKTAAAHARDWKIFYLRNKEGDELDFLIEGANQTRLALEVKWNREQATSWALPRRLQPLVDEAPCAVVSYLGGPPPQANIAHLAVVELAAYLLSQLD